MYNKKTKKINVKNKTRKKKSSVYKKYKNSKYGGKAINSGSYGCVFNPPLKCLDKTVPYNPNNISKLMYTEDANTEMSEIKKVKEIVDKIPNNEKYFIVSSVTQCNPDKLSKEDLELFNSECALFTDDDINDKNLNENLSKLSVINMLNGGSTLNDFWKKLFSKKNLFNKFFTIANNSLIVLLINGIIPLNSKRFIHNDIKADNLVMSSDHIVRIIDWGLACEYDGKTIPEAIKNRGLSFNVPFSSIFFNSFIKLWLKTEYERLKKLTKYIYKINGQKELLKIIAVNLINYTIEKTGDGHYDYITKVLLHDIYKLYTLNKYNRLDYTILIYNILVEYIAEVLFIFVDENGVFNDVSYFYNVYSHNVDIWGFLISYFPIIKYNYNNLSYNTFSLNYNKEIIDGLCIIFFKYCFSTEYAVKPINHADVINDLKTLNI